MAFQISFAVEPKNSLWFPLYGVSIRTCVSHRRMSLKSHWNRFSFFTIYQLYKTMPRFNLPSICSTSGTIYEIVVWIDHCSLTLFIRDYILNSYGKIDLVFSKCKEQPLWTGNEAGIVNLNHIMKALNTVPSFDFVGARRPLRIFKEGKVLGFKLSWK